MSNPYPFSQQTSVNATGYFFNGEGFVELWWPVSNATIVSEHNNG